MKEIIKGLPCELLESDYKDEWKVTWNGHTVSFIYIDVSGCLGSSECYSVTEISSEGETYRPDHYPTLQRAFRAVCNYVRFEYADVSLGEVTREEVCRVIHCETMKQLSSGGIRCLYHKVDVTDECPERCAWFNLIKNMKSDTLSE